MPASTPVADPESLLSEHLPVARKVAQETKRKIPCVDFDEVFSTAQNALWEACQKWNGRGVFEAFFRYIFKRRLNDAFRQQLGRTKRQQERRGSKVERVCLDKEIGGRPISELVSFTPITAGNRFQDLAEEIFKCNLGVPERIVTELVILQERPPADAALVLGVTKQRVSQIRIAVLKKIAARLGS